MDIEEISIKKIYSVLFVKKFFSSETIGVSVYFHNVAQLFSEFQKIIITFKQDEKIDHFDIIKLGYFIQDMKMQCNSLQIKFEKKNFVLEKSLQLLIQPFITQNLASFSIVLEDQQDIQVKEYLTTLRKCFKKQKLIEFGIKIQGLFTILHNSTTTSIDIRKNRNNINFSEECFHILSLIYSENLQNIQSIAVAIGENNYFQKGLEYFKPVMDQHRDTLKAIEFNIGQDCKLECSSLVNLLKYVHQAAIIKHLRIKIGASNLLDESLVYVITQIAFETPLSELSLDIGNQTKIFSNPFPVYENQKLNEIRILNLQLGKMNLFRSRGIAFFAKLIESKHLKQLSLRIGELNQIEIIQSTHLFEIISRNRQLENLELNFEKKMNINDVCINLLTDTLEKQSNLKTLSINLSQQQDQSQQSVMRLMLQISQLPQLVELKLNFRIGFVVGTGLSQTALNYQILQNLSVVEISFRGDNQIDFNDYKKFLNGIKQNQSLRCLQVCSGFQQPKLDSTDIPDQLDVMSFIFLQPGNILISEFDYQNQYLYFKYNFASLHLFLGKINFNIYEGLIQNIEKFQPTVDIQIIIQYSNYYDYKRDQLKDKYNFKLLSVLLSIAKQQSQIEIKFMKFFHLKKSINENCLIVENKQNDLLKEDLIKLLTQIQIPIENLDIKADLTPFQQLNVSVLLLQKLFDYKEINVQYTFDSNEILSINPHNSIFRFILSQEQHQQSFQSLIQILETLRDFEIPNLIIKVQTFDTNLDWKSFGKALSNGKIRSLNLSLGCQQQNMQNINQLMQFHFCLLNITATNQFLTNFNENNPMSLNFETLFKQTLFEELDIPENNNEQIQYFQDMRQNMLKIWPRIFQNCQIRLKHIIQQQAVFKKLKNFKKKIISDILRLLI